MSNAPEAVPPAEPVHVPVAASTLAPVGLRISPVVALVLALVAGAGTWLALDRTYPAFDIPEELKSPPSPTPPEEQEKINAATVRMNRQNSIYAYVWIGALGGLLLGAAEGYKQRQLVWAFVGLVVVAVVGAIGGASGACSAHELAEWIRLRETDDPLLLSMQLSIAAHGVGWAILGASLGLGLAMLGRSPRTLARATLGGAVGGAIAGAVFPMIAAALWPNANTEALVPAINGARIFWLLSGLGLASLGAVLMGRENRL